MCLTCLTGYIDKGLHFEPDNSVLFIVLYKNSFCCLFCVVLCCCNLISVYVVSYLTCNQKIYDASFNLLIFLNFHTWKYQIYVHVTFPSWSCLNHNFYNHLLKKAEYGRYLVPQSIHVKCHTCVSWIESVYPVWIFDSLCSQGVICLNIIDTVSFF